MPPELDESKGRMRNNMRSSRVICYAKIPLHARSFEYSYIRVGFCLLYTVPRRITTERLYVEGMQALGQRIGITSEYHCSRLKGLAKLNQRSFIKTEIRAQKLGTNDARRDRSTRKGINRIKDVQIVVRMESKASISARLSSGSLRWCFDIV